MTSEDLKRKIELRFGEIPDVVELHRKEYFIDSKSGQTWKSHLQRTFSIRLKEKGVAKAVSNEIDHFLKYLDKMNENSSLSSFSASSKKMYYSGWIIDNEIAFCIPAEKMK